jgi:hypothetical protein
MEQMKPEGSLKFHSLISHLSIVSKAKSLLASLLAASE